MRLFSRFHRRAGKRATCGKGTKEEEEGKDCRRKKKEQERRCRFRKHIFRFATCQMPRERVKACGLPALHASQSRPFSPPTPFIRTTVHHASLSYLNLTRSIEFLFAQKKQNKKRLAYFFVSLFASEFILDSGILLSLALVFKQGL